MPFCKPLLSNLAYPGVTPHTRSLPPLKMFRRSFSSQKQICLVGTAKAENALLETLPRRIALS